MESTRVWYLKRINLFRLLSEDDLQGLRQISEEHLYQRRQLIFRAEDPGDAVHLVEAGQVRLSRFDAGGREITLAVLVEGELFGEEARPSRARREGLAEALDETRIHRIARVDYEQFLHDHADLALLVARHLGERLLGSPSELDNLDFRDPTAKVAGALSALVRRYGEPLDEGGTRIAQGIANQELAGLVGLTREAVTSVLSTFEREGRLAVEGGCLVVRDASLTDLARDR